MSFKSIAEFLALTGPDAPTTAEKDLIKATQAGEACWLCDPDTPARPSAATNATRIRASLLRLLITGGSKDCGLHERGVTLFGGWIEGPLDLAWCKARGQTGLSFCHFPDEPRLEGARFQLLGLSDSAFPKGLYAQGAQVQGSVFLSHIIANSRIALNSAKIGGQLAFAGATLDGGKDANGAQQEALNAQGVETGQSLFLRTVTATGTVSLNSAKIGGQLTCSGAALDGGKDSNGAQQTALNAQGVETGQSLFLRAITATGTVDMNGAKIGGQLDCTGAILDGGKDAKRAQQEALNAQRVETGQSLFLNAVTATGRVQVNGAKIGGQLSCTGATLDGGKDANGSQQEALNAAGVETEQDLFLSTLTATGTIAVNGAKIGGQLACEGASFDGGTDADGTQQGALTAQRLRVTEGLIFRDVKKVTGQVNLTAAHVGDLVDDATSWPLGTDDLILDGFTYDRTDGPTTLTARRDWLRAGSHLWGEFYPQPYTQFARVLRQMGHAGEARMVLIEAAQVAAKTLERQHRARRRFARAVRRFSTNPDERAFARLKDALGNLPASLRAEANTTTDLFKRLHHPPPTAAGATDPLDPLTLSYAQQDFRNQMLVRAASSRMAIIRSRVKHAFLNRIVGHGHAPQRAIWAVMISTGLAALWYGHAWQAGAMVPNSDVILTSFNWWWAMQDQAMSPTADWTATGTAQHYETFYSLAYAFDVIVPLVDIGQKSAWSATTVTWTGWSTRVLTMVLEVWGWVVTALGAAAVTGLVQRNQPD